MNIFTFFILGIISLPLFGVVQYCLCGKEKKRVLKFIPPRVCLLITLAFVVYDYFFMVSNSWVGGSGILSALTLGFFSAPAAGGILLGALASKFCR